MSGWDPASFRRACEAARRTLIAQARGFPIFLVLIGGKTIGPGVVVERDHERDRMGETTVAVRLEPGDWTHLGHVAEVVSASEMARRTGAR